MHRLAALSLANRALIALVTVSIAFFGVLSMQSLKQELIPSITLPMVSVVTSYPGASPQIVDEEVSRPVEAAMQGLDGLETTTTTSAANLSTVTVEFRYGTDLVAAQQRMQLAVNRIADTLPDSATTTILAGSIDDFPVLQIAATGPEPASLAALVRQQTLGELLDLDGVRDATLEGAAAPRIGITPDEAQLAALGASRQTIADTLEYAGVLIPVGQLDEGDETLTVQAGTVIDTVEQIAALPLQGITDALGQPVRLDRIATVVSDTEPVDSISRVNGADALTISITKRPDANTVELSQAVRAALPELAAALGEGVELVPVFDQAPFVERSIEALVVEGLLGLGFAVLVILVFLLSVRATVVTAISIPTSLLVTFIGLQAADYSLNILTLGALTIAIGRVVDDSIVVIENINRHMALHPAAVRRGEQRSAVILAAVREVAGAITASTIATVAVYLPIAFVSDISGELFRPFALTSVIALLASLVVSLTIVPVLAYWTLGGGRLKASAGASVASATDETAAGAAGARAETPAQLATAPATAASPRAGRHAAAAAATEGVLSRRARRERETQQLPASIPATSIPAADATAAALASTADEPRSWLQRRYEPVLRWTLRRPWATLLLALLVLVGTGAAAPLMKTNFLGDSGSDTFTVSQTLPANASLDARDAAAGEVEGVLLATEGVQTVQLTIGGDSLLAGFGLGGGGAVASFSVITAEDADAAAVQDEVREQLERREGIGEISLGSTGGGFSSDLTVELRAPEQTSLTEATAAVSAGLQAAGGFLEVRNSLDETRPFVQIDVDPAAAAEVGLTEFAVGTIVAGQLQPTPVGDIAIDGATVRIVLLGQTPPQTLSELQQLPIPTALGPQPLTSLAGVSIVDGPVAIRAQQGTPTATITIVPEGDNLTATNQQVQEVLDGLELPAGVTAQLGGVSADQQAAFEQLGLALLAAILIVYIVMVATFRSLVQPLLLLISVPFAATGAVLLQLLSGVPLGVASMIGVLMLIGIVVTNAIVLIDLVNQFRERGLEVREAIVEGGSRRLRPILMTALATILALTPMAIGITGHSGFISQPLALVVIGGLLSSTVLTLLVLPALYAVVEVPVARRRAVRAARAEQELAAAGLGAAVPG